jgi:MFS family permease
MTGPMEFAPAHRRPTYVALAGAGYGLVAAAAPLLGGQVIAQLGYEWLFAGSAAVSLAGALVLTGRRRR